jgi:hypothetical protein
MNASLFCFLRQFGAVVIATVMLVLLLAFLSMPYLLGGHPGETRAAVLQLTPHPS